MENVQDPLERVTGNLASVKEQKKNVSGEEPGALCGEFL